MAELKLNKTELKAQKTLLSQLTKYLPTLQLKKQQLQSEVDKVRAEYEAIEQEIKDRRASLSEWSELLSQKLTIHLFQVVEIEEITTRSENIAGVDVPFFDTIRFKDITYSTYIKPVWLDRATKELRELVSLREKKKVTAQRTTLLEEELRQTSIKVNLFEKRMIPQTKENIRRIKIFLGDQEIAAICNAKIAKDKLRKKAAEAAMEDGND